MNLKIFFIIFIICFLNPQMILSDNIKVKKYNLSWDPPCEAVTFTKNLSFYQDCRNHNYNNKKADDETVSDNLLCITVNAVAGKFCHMIANIDQYKGLRIPDNIQKEMNDLSLQNKNVLSDFCKNNSYFFDYLNSIPHLENFKPSIKELSVILNNTYDCITTCNQLRKNIKPVCLFLIWTRNQFSLINNQEDVHEDTTNTPIILEKKLIPDNAKITVLNKESMEQPIQKDNIGLNDGNKEPLTKNLKTNDSNDKKKAPEISNVETVFNPVPEKTVAKEAVTQSPPQKKEDLKEEEKKDPNLPVNKQDDTIENSDKDDANYADENMQAIGPELSGNQKNLQEGSRTYKAEEIESSDSNLVHYFSIFTILFIVLYVGLHNKQKILAMLLEGRRSRRNRGSRRRPSTANYRRLDSNLEEAVTSQLNNNATQVIY